MDGNIYELKMEMILDAIAKAIEEAKQDESKPTLIEVRTVIGYGSPNKSGKADSHGAPLGADEIKLTKEAYKWTFEEGLPCSSKKFMTISTTFNS